MRSLDPVVPRDRLVRRQSWLPLLAATGAAAAVASALVVWLRVIGLNASASQPHETSLAAQTIVTACLSIASFALFAALFAWPILRRELARIEATRIEGDRLVTASLRHAGEHAALLAENHLVRQSLVSLESAIDEEGQAKDAFARESGMGATLLVENHLRLDEAIDDQLRVVVSETEASAMGLIGQVRTLNDAVAELLGYLGNSGRSAGDMETEIEGSVASIAQISRFVRELPDLIRKNANSIHAATLQEISGISGLAAVIQDISKQTNILAINAAIVAATAGEAGLGFAVVATEVRKLAVRSSTAANMIEEGVAEAQRVMMEGLRHTGMSEEIAEAGAMITSIHKLEANYENIRKYYHSMFVVVTEYNTKLATEIADMLGQIQYQDVVRQRIERVTSAVARRNQVLRDLPGTFSESATGLTGLAAQIHEVLDDYLVGEERHTVGVAADSDSGDVLPKFELF